ncbi:MAG: hypothetical protein SF053_16510 [Bacteroidia bacterium]|nr:hypothetical protein [Bacteroidia bacterium]
MHPRWHKVRLIPAIQRATPAHTSCVSAPFCVSSSHASPAAPLVLLCLLAPLRAQVDSLYDSSITLGAACR